MDLDASWKDWMEFSTDSLSEKIFSRDLSLSQVLEGCKLFEEIIYPSMFLQYCYVCGNLSPA